LAFLNGLEFGFPKGLGGSYKVFGAGTLGLGKARELLSTLVSAPAIGLAHSISPFTVLSVTSGINSNLSATKSCPM